MEDGARGDGKGGRRGWGEKSGRETWQYRQRGRISEGCPPDRSSDALQAEDTQMGLTHIRLVAVDVDLGHCEKLFRGFT